MKKLSLKITLSWNKYKHTFLVLIMFFIVNILLFYFHVSYFMECNMRQKPLLHRKRLFPHKYKAWNISILKVWPNSCRFCFLANANYNITIMRKNKMNYLPFKQIAVFCPTKHLSLPFAYKYFLSRIIKNSFSLIWLSL